MQPRMLPNNIEAEKAVLGSILIDDRCFPSLTSFLRSGHFYRDAHRVIYEAMCTLYAKRETIDFITVSDELERHLKLEQVGGSDYIVSLVSVVPTSASAMYYGHIVEKKGIFRALIGAAGEIAASAYEEDEAILTQAQEKIFKAAQTSSGNAIVSHRTALTEYMTMLNTLYDQQQEGTLTGIPSGFKRLDSLLGGFRGAKLYILAARPGDGKTAMALNFAHHAMKQGCRVLIFSIEMDRMELMQRYVALESHVNSKRLRDVRLNTEDEHGRSDWEHVVDGVDRLQTATGTLWIDDTPGNNIDLIRARAMQMKTEEHIDFIMLDYLQLTNASADEGSRRGQDRRLDVEKVSRDLKGMARELNVPVLALAQLNRNSESRPGRTPQLSDLRETGAIEQDGDVVMFITKGADVPQDATEWDTSLNIEKNRNGERGVVPLHYVGAYTQFYPRIAV